LRELETYDECANHDNNHNAIIQNLENSNQAKGNTHADLSPEQQSLSSEVH